MLPGKGEWGLRWGGVGWVTMCWNPPTIIIEIICRKQIQECLGHLEKLRLGGGVGEGGGGTTYLLPSDVSFSMECLFIWAFWRCFKRTVFQTPFSFYEVFFIVAPHHNK
jgi:hypothetical protein